MGRIKSKLQRILKKIMTSFKRNWRKLKYLDKTKYNYFIVTSFIGVFCMFTGFTYSAFVVSKYLSAATITIAKLNYTLASSSSAYNNGVITVPANSTEFVNLTLTSNNPIDTRYALNYLEASDPGITVKYSQNIKYNIKGIIGTSGSSIDLRVVVQNTTAAQQTVKLNVLGGYKQNSLTTNISEGYYEQDVIVRTTLLDENFGNATSTSAFPERSTDYVYYKTECNAPANPVWDSESWALNLNQLDSQISCDVYFKKTTDDIEIYFMTFENSESKGVISSTPPASDTYKFRDADCTTGSATWNTETNKLEVTGVKDRTLCVANFVHK